ncbi:MAG TPA: heme-binding protein [Pseudolabrys sp.]|nr:heme-binding protein [Pseudolabrys sp.]
MKRMILAAVLALAAVLPARAEEAIVTYKSIAPDIAIDLARAALNRCRKDGYQVAVVVLDRFGAPLVEMRDRFAGIGAMDIARGKAWTAVNFSIDSGEFVKRIKDGTLSPGLASLPKVTPLVGGIIIQAGGSIIGGVGVAGAPGGDKDEACAKAGLESVQDKLDF